MTPPPAEDLLAELPWLRRFAAGLCRSAADADDLVQDTLSEAMRSTGPRGPLRGLLGGIAKNLARARHRDRARRAVREDRHAADLGEPISAASDVETERLDLLRALLAELQTLPPAQRRAITARYLDELEPAEIARRDGVSPSSVRSQLARGLAALRERLDAEEGGRDRWMGCLAPWALPPFALDPAALAPPSQITAPPPSQALPPPASLPSLLGGSLAALTAMKLATLLVLPALLAVFWWTRPDPISDAVETSLPALEETVDLQQLASTTQETSRSTAAPLPREAAPAKSASEAAAPPVWTDLNGSFIDMLTGEAVPHLRATFMALASTHGDSVDSDASGHFVLERYGSLPVESLRLVERDFSIHGQDAIPRQSSLTYPISGPIPVHVGPTFRFDLPAELLERPSRVSIRLREKSDTNPYDDPRGSLRDGDKPWARLPRQVTELEQGPFDLVLEDLQGMRVARLEVDRSRGIEPRILRPDFQPCGAIRFVLDIEGAASAPALKFDVDPIGHMLPGDVERRVLTGEHRADGSAAGTLKMLPPGDYRWSLRDGGAGAEGEVTVAAGETTEVQVGMEHLGATFSADVRIDASAAPDADPTRWLVMVSSKDELGAGFMTRPEPVGPTAPGQFIIPLRAMAHGTWHVAIQAPSDVTLSTSSLEVTPGAPPDVISVTAGSSRRTLELEVVNSLGQRLPSAKANVLIIPSEQIRFRSTAGNLLISDELPGDLAVEVFVRAPGYRSVLLEHDARTDPSARRVALELGWSTRVMALDASTLTPVLDAEILVDGEPAGRPGENGWCWIEADEAPLRIELRLEDPNLENLGSNIDGPGVQVEDLDPPEGVLFLVAPKGGQ